MRIYESDKIVIYGDRGDVHIDSLDHDPATKISSTEAMTIATALINYAYGYTRPKRTQGCHRPGGH